MTSSVKVNVENIIVLSTYAYTYVCQISRHKRAIFVLSCSQKKWLEIRKIYNKLEI